MGVDLAQAGPVSNLVVERVDASFVYPRTGRGYDYLVLYALRRTDPETGRFESVKAYAGRGDCLRSQGQGLACQTKVHPYKVVRFRANEAFTHVMVVLRLGHTTHHLSFRTRDDHDATGRQVPNECGGLSIRNYEIARSATARGRLFGRRVSSKTEWRRDIESVSRYAEIGVCP